MILHIRAILWRWRFYFLALLCLAVCAFIGQAIASNNPEYYRVLAASHTLQAGSYVQKDDFHSVHVPKEALPHGWVSHEEIEDILHQPLAVSIPEGAIATTSYFLGKDFLSLAPPGYAIVPVILERNGIENLITTGVSITLYPPASEFSENTEVAPIIEGARVVGISQEKTQGGFLSRDEESVRIFVSLPYEEVRLVHAFPASSALRAVVAVQSQQQ